MSIDRKLVALLAVLVAAPSLYAAPCTVTSNFPEVMQAVEQEVPCANATRYRKYTKQAKQALGGLLSKSCKKLFVKRYILRSTCGRANFEVCCDTNKKGKDTSRVVRKGRCKGQVCAAAPTSVGEGCMANGQCVPTTTTTTSTTTTTTRISTTSTSTSSTAPPTSTTTTIPPGCGDGVIGVGEECDGGDFGSFVCPTPGGQMLCRPNCTRDLSQCPEALTTLEFSLRPAGGVCGDIRDAGGPFRNLTCGGLSIGGGGSFVAEGPTPDGSISRFSLACTGSNCTIGPTSATPPVNTPGPDCTNTGCNFGTPLPVPNGGTSTCVLNTWTAPASGTIDLASGSSSTNVPLQSYVVLTGNPDQPCPKCSATGSPSSPGTGTCDRGPRTGLACTTTNSQGLTRDCPPGGADATHPCTPGQACIDGTFVGTIPVNLSPLSTATVTKTAADGAFCPDQTVKGTTGCFGSAREGKACTAITENGTPAGPVLSGVFTDATLASVFCIPATGNLLIDGTAALPGPGAVSLPGTFIAR
jgi:mucin-6/19